MRICIAVAISALAAGFAAAEATLADVLGRAATYVARFQRQLSGIVGEEHYVQDVHGGQPVNPVRTELRSNLLLLRDGRAGYVQFRDVFEADGVAVRDRADRFERRRESPESADSFRMRILEENARFNVGDLFRTMNVPLLALEFLSRDNQWRFSFKRAKDRGVQIGERGDAPPGTFRVSTDVWVIEYEEKEPRTMIRTVDGRDLKSRGRIWLEPDSGRIVMTELHAKNREIDAVVTVSFKSEPLLGMLVPVEMRERYRSRRGSNIDAAAVYGRFRPLRPGAPGVDDRPRPNQE